MKNLKTQLAALLLSTVCWLTGAHAQLTPSADAYTNSAAPTTNYGAATILDVENANATETVYIQFNLSSIPAGYTGANITKATLKLYVNAVTTAGSFNVDYVNGTWAEKTITASLAPALGTTIAASVPLTTASKNQYILIDITSAVQAWLNGSQPNDGVALVANSPLNANFDSKESTSTSHAAELDLVFVGGGTLTGVTTASGSGLTGGGSSGTLNLSLIHTCAAKQVLQWNGSAWACASAGTGTITGVTAGTDLTGGGTSGTVTLNVDTTKVVTGVTAGTDLTGGGTGGVQTLNLDTTKVPQLGASNTFTGNQTVIGTFGVRGNGNNLLVGDPGCGSGFAGFGFLPSGGLSGCVNYALLGDSTGGTYINSGMGATIHFRNYNSELATIDNSGNVAVYGKNGGGNMTVAGVLTVNGNQAVSSGPGGSFAGYSAPSGSGRSGGDGIDSTGGNGDTSIPGYGGAGVTGFGGKGGNNGIVIEDGAGGHFAGGNSGGGLGTGDGVDVFAGSGYAGYFTGNIRVTGAISAGTKDFQIDHPLDPANKYLVHASVESSEMMNIYTGNVTTDGQGHATVQLPEWFEVLNTDFRYQLTVMGQFAQAIVAGEIENNQFEIRTSVPNVKVSWQVTGVRQDAYAKANPLLVEQEKEERLRGFYIHPELYGAPPEKQIEWARHPQMMKKIQEMRAKQLAGRAVPPAAAEPR